MFNGVKGQLLCQRCYHGLVNIIQPVVTRPSYIVLLDFRIKPELVRLIISASNTRRGYIDIPQIVQQHFCIIAI